MKNGKASGPSAVVTEILKASPYICSEMIADLTNSIVQESMMPMLIYYMLLSILSFQ